MAESHSNISVHTEVCEKINPAFVALLYTDGFQIRIHVQHRCDACARQPAGYCISAA